MPASISGDVFSFIITSATPPFATFGNYKILFSSSGTFNLLDASGGIVSSQHGTYTYAKTGAASATINYHFISPANFPDASGNEPTTLSFSTATSGNYTGIGGGGSNNGTFTLATGAPVFSQQPQSQPVAAGSNITLTAAVTTPLPTTYQWQKAGVAIIGASTVSLPLNNASAITAGSYTLTATNAAGSATSSAAVITVTGLPELPPVSIANYVITFAISSATAPFATSGSYRILFSADGRFNLLDQSGNIASNQNGTYTYAKTGTTTATLNYHFLSPANFPDASGNEPSTLTFSTQTAGTYAATGGGGANAGTFTLAPSIPLFTTQPQNQTVNAGSTLTLTVVIASAVPATLQWQKDGTAIAEATNVSLVVPNVGAANAGTYRVIAINSTGSATSSSATVAVTGDLELAPSSIANQVISFTIGRATAPFATSGTYQILFTANGTFSLLDASGNIASNQNGTYIYTKTSATTAALNYHFLNPANFPDASGNEPSSLTFTGRGAGTYSGTGGGGSNAGSFTLTGNIPIFIANPISQYVAPGTPLVLSGQASFATSTQFQWYKDGEAIIGATGAGLRLPATCSANAGSYSLVATNASGTTRSSAAVITVGDSVDWAPSSISNTALNFRIAAGTSPFATAGDYRIMFTTTGAFIVFEQSGNIVSNQYGTYNYTRNGTTSATLRYHFVSPVNFPDASGDSTVTLAFTTEGAGTYSGAAAGGSHRGTFAVTSSRIANLSIRSTAGTGAQTLIAGFAVSGGIKSLLIRGIGPTLEQFGVGGAMSDPVLNFYTGSTMAATNDNWGTAPNAARIAAAAIGNGAFPLATTSRDAALLNSVAETSFTAQVEGPASGIALVEIYDTDSTHTPAHLVNVSARTQVGTGDRILIAGFVIQGDAPKTLLIRGIGPTLADFAVTGSLVDPQLSLFSGSRQLAANDNWSSGADTAQITSAATRVGAFALRTGSRDSALLVTLYPGSYTAQVSGVGNTVGIALVEIYEVP